jgi:hypothetical protein
LAASNDAMLMFTNRTPSRAKAVRDAVVKSAYRVPMPITRSASRARAFAAALPVAPTAPADDGWSYEREPLPAYVSATGMPVASTRARSASVASE